ncbi:MAG TPA: PLDc N-terminal domain-containing protein [Actinomycetes bacterium]
MLKVLVFLAVVTFGVWALLDVAQTPADRIRGLSKSGWSLAVLVPLLGPVAWFMQGRTPVVAPTRREARPLAPDDDPEFLRHLGDHKHPDGS